MIIRYNAIIWSDHGNRAQGRIFMNSVFYCCLYFDIYQWYMQTPSWSAMCHTQMSHFILFHTPLSRLLEARGKNSWKGVWYLLHRQLKDIRWHAVCAPMGVSTVRHHSKEPGRGRPEPTPTIYATTDHWHGRPRLVLSDEELLLPTVPPLQRCPLGRPRSPYGKALQGVA